MFQFNINWVSLKKITNSGSRNFLACKLLKWPIMMNSFRKA